MKRVVGCQIREVFRPRAVEEGAEALRSGDPEVMRAFGADADILLKVLVVDELRAIGTLDPEPLGHTARFFGRRRGHGLPGLLEPGHRPTLPQVKAQKSKVKESPT